MTDNPCPHCGGTGRARPMASPIMVRMRERGISLRQLADTTGIYISKVAFIEFDILVPTTGELEAIANALGCKPEDLER